MVKQRPWFVIQSLGRAVGAITAVINREFEKRLIVVSYEIDVQFTNKVVCVLAFIAVGCQ